MLHNRKVVVHAGLLRLVAHDTVQRVRLFEVFFVSAVSIDNDIAIENKLKT